MDYFDLPDEKREKVRGYFLDFLFTRNQFTLISSTQIEGGFDSSIGRLSNDTKFDVIVRLDTFFRDNFAQYVKGSKDFFLSLAKKQTKSWTLDQPTAFFTDEGEIRGRIVTDINGSSLIDFWFENGYLYIEVICYGFSG